MNNDNLKCSLFIPKMLSSKIYIQNAKYSYVYLQIDWPDILLSDYSFGCRIMGKFVRILLTAFIKTLNPKGLK